MAINFGGEFNVERTPEEVYDFLTDPNQFAPLLPEFQGMSIQDAVHFTVKVKVGISHIKGTAEVKMELAQAERASRALYKGQGSVAGGNVLLNATFDLSGANGITKVVWKGDAQIFGRLTSLAGGLLEPLGRKNAQKLIDSLQAALNECSTSSSHGTPIANEATSTPSAEAKSIEIGTDKTDTTANHPTSGAQT